MPQIGNCNKNEKKKIQKKRILINYIRNTGIKCYLLDVFEIKYKKYIFIQQKTRNHILTLIESNQNQIYITTIIDWFVYGE